ncbi:MAG: metal ABC transporter solute-binding protein, Zn/Mn family [Solirubrobacterales bacterium]
MHRVLPSIAVGILVLLAGCGQGESTATGAGGRLQVVAAENFWGSIAAQLGGARVQVRSIVADPGTDPHSYEPTARDARTMAEARLAIVNGVGYDEWASKLLAASPASGRTVLNVGDLLGLREGDNPHRWYFPANVLTVVDRIVADYDRLDPAAAAYFAQRKRTFETQGLARYDELRRAIRARYAGTPVGYSESIFQGLGEDLGLKLLTPYSFAKAIAEGTEVTAQDKRTVDSQAEDPTRVAQPAKGRLAETGTCAGGACLPASVGPLVSGHIDVWVFNSQNVTPDVQRVNELARAAQIPIATVTETLSPASDSFEQWQVAELEGLARALHEATGR